MASPFAKYQSEQVQQIAPGFVEAYGQAGRSIGQGIASIGQSVAQGIEAADKKQKEQEMLKGALAPYIKNDERVKRAEDFEKAGIFVKAADGTLTLSANWADKVNMPEVDKVLSFYNQTGGDGSKLEGRALDEFTARYQGEQKYISDQAAKAAAQVEIDYKKAQIAELKSKAAERVTNAGIYGGMIQSILGGEGDSTLPSVTLPDTTTAPFNAPAEQPVSKADTTLPGVAAPAALSPALTAGTAAAPAPAAAAPAEAKSYADLYNQVTPEQQAAMDKAAKPAKPAEMPAAPAAKEAPAPAAPAPAAAQAAAAAPAAAPAATPAPAAPQTFDVAAKAAEVGEKMKAIETRRAAVRERYNARRVQMERDIVVSNRNAKNNISPNQAGAKFALSIAAFNQDRIKTLATDEARDMKAIDDEASAVKTDFTNYQAAAEAARKNRTEQREVAKETRTVEKAKADFKIRIAEDYPMIGVWTYQGYGMKDPKTGEIVDPAVTAGIGGIDKQVKFEVSEQNKGYGSAQNFLLNMEDILRGRGEGYKERFRLTATNMENYFKAELASVFGVAAFRKPIVSGGNFSDADREFVKQAITYLNTAAIDMSPQDLKASLNALSFMINGLYQQNLEELGMSYNPEAAKERATALRAGGDKAGAATIEEQVKRTERFYNTFNLNQNRRISSIGRDQIDAARTQLQSALKMKK